MVYFQMRDPIVSKTTTVLYFVLNYYLLMLLVVRTVPQVALFWSRILDAHMTLCSCRKRPKPTQLVCCTCCATLALLCEGESIDGGRCERHGRGPQIDGR